MKEEELNENPVNQYYTSLYNDVEIHRDQLFLISQEIIKNEVSNYPIFIAHNETINIGKPILSREKQLTNWEISVSILEELVNKKIVAIEKVDEFRKVYKNPQQYFCFLVITENDSQFIFLKRSRHNSPLIHE